MDLNSRDGGDVKGGGLGMVLPGLMLVSVARLAQEEI